MLVGNAYSEPERRIRYRVLMIQFGLTKPHTVSSNVALHHEAHAPQGVTDESIRAVGA